MPGGHGNNVARVLAAQGHSVVATGFLAGGVECETVPTPEPHRVSPGSLRGPRGPATPFWIEGAKAATEVLEAGPTISDADGNRFLEHLSVLLNEADAVVIAGSAPVGVTSDFLERLAVLVRSRSNYMIVDSSGQSLDLLLNAHPDLIKPNRSEMQTLMGRPGSIKERISYARDRLIGGRLACNANVLMSLGAAGAVLVSRSCVLFARAPTVDVVNTVGCGDALLAGYLHGRLGGLDEVECLGLAVAFGTAAALQEVAGLVEASDVPLLQSRIQIIDFEDARGAM